MGKASPIQNLVAQARSKPTKETAQDNMSPLTPWSITSHALVRNCLRRRVTFWARRGQSAARR